MSRSSMAVLIVATIAVSSCDDLGTFDRARQDFHYSYSLQPGGALDIHNTNGSIDISGWDRNTIDISGTKFAPREEELKDVQIKVDVSGNNASIRTEWPKDAWHGGFGARYTIRVPSRILLDRAQTTNGSLTVEDLEGGGQVQSTNGRIAMTSSSGDYDVQTTNGAIELEECSGAERAQTTNGPIRGQLKMGAVDARSTNGSIDLTIQKPQDGKALRIYTTNGALKLSLAEFHDNPITAETTHGSITLQLPAGTDAQMSARTSFSDIRSDIPFSSTEEISKHELKAQLGRGGPPISLRTTTGSVHIERY